MKLLVIVSDSLHVFRGINDIAIIRGGIVLFFKSMDSFGVVIKLEPFSTLLSFWVHVVSFDGLSELVLNKRLSTVRMMLSEDVRCAGVLDQEENCKAQS